MSAKELGLPSLFAKLSNIRDATVGKKGLDGRRLRTGLLFRSAKLFKLPDSDKRLLQQLGISFVADFRSQDELMREPDSFALGHDPMHRLFVAVDGDPRVLIEKFIREGGGPPGYATEQMKEINRKFVKVHARPFREFLESLAQDGGLPALVHCTAGKDRTGWAVSLLLIVLGVSEDDVVQEYVTSNRLYYKEARKYMVMIRLFSRFRISHADMVPLLVVKPEFLQEALVAAKVSHGSLDKYITAPDGLGLSLQTVEKLRERFLEKA